MNASLKKKCRRNLKLQASKLLPSSFEITRNSGMWAAYAAASKLPETVVCEQLMFALNAIDWSQVCLLVKGPFINDVIQFLKFFDPLPRHNLPYPLPPPCVTPNMNGKFEFRLLLDNQTQNQLYLSIVTIIAFCIFAHIISLSC